MKILHNRWATAGSRRQEGMPLFLLAEDGRLLRVRGGTRKEACIFYAPTTVVGAAVLYRACSGKRYIQAYTIEAGGRLRYKCAWAEEQVDEVPEEFQAFVEWLFCGDDDSVPADGEI